jgi:hypothetical protein
MVLEILLLMLLAHCIDDFVLQVVLAKLKQKDWWTENGYVTEQNQLYKDDYKMALFLHSLEWSIMIHLPIMFFCDLYTIHLALSVGINCLIHYIVDDAKANKKTISLVTDQQIHIMQILVTLSVIVIMSMITNFEAWVA